MHLVVGFGNNNRQVYGTFKSPATNGPWFLNPLDYSFRINVSIVQAQEISVVNPTTSNLNLSGKIGARRYVDTSFENWLAPLVRGSIIAVSSRSFRILTKGAIPDNS